jgi:curved DNA-binding protein CbpA
MTSTSTISNQRSYYEVLEVPTNASDIEIKKAYRRLALQWHPDRNNGSEESTEKFKEIGEAYSCLSNPVTKYDYDTSLRDAMKQQQRNRTSYYQSSSPSQQPASSTNGSRTTTKPSSYHYYPRSNNQYSKVFPSSTTGAAPPGVRRTGGRMRNSDNFNPYSQFDNLFGHDPFFQEAFQDMDEEFTRRFVNNREKPTTTSSSGQQQHDTSTIVRGAKEQQQNQHQKNKIKSKEGWIPWLFRQCGIEFSFTSYAQSMGGGITTTTYTSKGKSSYTQKRKEVYRDWQGRLVTIQSMEQDGNQIEDTYINNKLIQRKVNGIIEPIERIKY